MEYITWSEEDIALYGDSLNGSLQLEQNFKEIDSFYDVQQGEAHSGGGQHEPALPGADAISCDESATLTSDVDVLTGSSVTFTHTQPQTDAEPHCFDNPSEVNGGSAGDFDRNDKPDQSASNSEQEQHTTVYDELSTSTQHSPVNHVLRQQDQPSMTTLTSSSQAPCDAQAAPRLVEEHEHSAPEYLTLFDLQETQGPKLAPSPIPDQTMTPPKPETAFPPSSEGKSFLFDEMRSEENWHPDTLQEVKVEVEVPNLELSASGTIMKAEDDSVEPSDEDALRKGSEIRAEDKYRNMVTELKNVAVPQRKAVQTIHQQATEKQSMQQLRRSRRIKQQIPGQSSHEGLSCDGEQAAEKEGVPEVKDKQDEDNEELIDGGHEIVEHHAKKTKTSDQDTNIQTPPKKSMAKAAMIPRGPRRNVGRHEIERLTGSTLQAADLPQHGKATARQTRLQKAKEADSTPNAGRAARDRHKLKGLGQEGAYTE